MKNLKKYNDTLTATQKFKRVSLVCLLALCFPLYMIIKVIIDAFKFKNV